MAAIYGQGVYGQDSYGQQENPALFLVAHTPELIAPAPTVQDTPADIGIGQDGELLMTPDGDLLLVDGAQRAMQDLWMLAATPIGGLIADPISYGNAFAGMVGRRMPTDTEAQADAAGLAQAMSDLHERRAALGTPPGQGELFAGIEVASVQRAGTALTVAVIAHFLAGGTAAGAVPLSGLGV